MFQRRNKMLNIALGVVFVILIIAMAIIAVKAEKLRWIIVAIIVGVGATIFMALYFHSWWFVLWAALLALAIYLLSVVTKVWLIVLLVAGLAVVAVGGLYLVIAPQFHSLLDGISFTNPVAENSATSNPGKNCSEAEVVESQTHGDKVLVDLNDGDPFDFSLTIVNPDFTAGNKTLVVLVEPMYIFDVVYPKMYFTSFRLRGTLDQALCSAQKLAGSNAFAYVYVGKEATPKGWSTVAIKGWWTELVAKQYSEQPITPGGTWAAFQVEDNNKANSINAKTQLVYGQMWDPNKPGIVVHFQIEKGYEFTIPAGWQGTYWTVVDADPVLVQDRLIQASKEVVERDALSISGKAVTLFYCGATTPDTELKIGADSLKWTTNLEDLGKSSLATWGCEVSK